MAPPSKIARLPQELRDELNRRILANGFADYDGLEAWLNAELQARGLEMTISRSAIHREGKKLEKLGERVRAMKMLQEGWQRQMGAKGLGELGRVLNAQLQGLAFALTQDVVDGKVEVDAEFLKDMSATIMRLERAASLNEERERTIREEERTRAREEAEAKLAELEQSGGRRIDAETLKLVREQLYGG